MNEINKNTKDVIGQQEVQEAAKILAKYNLGIFIPHMHNQETGEILALPEGVISAERDLKIKFVKIDALESDMIPIGWRWNGIALEVCASCCSSGPAD